MRRPPLRPRPRCRPRASGPSDETAGLGDVWYGMGEGLAEWLLTAPNGQQTTLQMAYFSRDREPVTMSVGPVLDLEDLVASKVAALATRVEPGDYIDTASALERYTPGQLISLAKRHDPGLDDQDFADAGRRLDQLGDRRFAALGLSPQDVVVLRERFAAWPRTAPQWTADPEADRLGRATVVLPPEPADADLEAGE